MKIVPANVERQISRVDRQHSLIIGISCGLLAFWSAYRVIWSLYLALTYNFLFGSLAFQVILWAMISAGAAIAATGFFAHYAKGSATDSTETEQR